MSLYLDIVRVSPSAPGEDQCIQLWAAESSVRKVLRLGSRGVKILEILVNNTLVQLFLCFGH